MKSFEVNPGSSYAVHDPTGKEICSNLVFCVNLGLLTLCFLTKLNESAKRQTLQVLQISLPTGMSRTFPNLTMESNIWGCYDPAAGVLMADKVARHFNPGIFNTKLLPQTFQP